MGAFGPNFPDFRAIWLGTTKPKLQNLYEAANQNIRTFISTKGYLWLTGTSCIDSAPYEPPNSNMFGGYRPGGGQMPNSDRSARSINFGFFLRKAGGISNLMQTLQNLGLSTTARNSLYVSTDTCYSSYLFSCVSRSSSLTIILNSKQCLNYYVLSTSRFIDSRIDGAGKYHNHKL
jgi:hypothetical protein